MQIHNREAVKHRIAANEEANVEFFSNFYNDQVVSLLVLEIPPRANSEFVHYGIKEIFSYSSDPLGEILFYTE